MPTYSYACTACHHAFDIRQSFTDDNLTVCPQCQEHALRKVIHPVGISFKGSGFYKTDSRALGWQGLERFGLGRLVRLVPTARSPTRPRAAPTPSTSSSSSEGSSTTKSSDTLVELVVLLGLVGVVELVGSSGSSGSSSGSSGSKPASSTSS